MAAKINSPRPAYPRWIALLLLATMIAAIAALMALASNRNGSLQGWGSFLGVLIPGVALLAGGWWSIRSESPGRWLAVVVVIGILLRLGAGAFWYYMLPFNGYHSPAEERGYVMADANERDQAAWELGRSDKPLTRAFEGSYHKADQYGGLLFLSAVIYRILGGPTHQPLIMVVVTAVFSSLAILFTWAFARRAWGDDTARLAAWGLALYPEAVLLGSSQMREAFMVTLAAAACYGLLLTIQKSGLRGLVWMGVALVLCLPFSPPFASLLLVILVLVAVVGSPGVFQRKVFRSRWVWLILGVLVMAMVVGIWLSWRRFIPEDGATDLVTVFNFWLRKSAEYQAHLSERASGWIQKIFDSTPAWAHLPLLLAYGVVQPLLPAALADITGAAIWQAIAIWRSLGWTILLPFLVYAPLRAFEPGEKMTPGRQLARGFSLAIWLVILVASFRSGGDPWDNPRYRAAFAALQLALAGWVWMEHRRAPHPGLRRVLVGAGLVLAWVVPWYLRRYIHLAWPVEDLFKTLGLGFACAVLYWLWDRFKPAPKETA